MDLAFLALGAVIFAVFGVYAALFEEDLTMIVGILYGAAALGVGVYMLWALLTPEKF